MKFKPVEVGLFSGLFFAILHAIWSFAVFAGVAKAFLNFALGLHFLKNPYVVMPFSFSNALMLVVCVFIVWFILGYLATICWNKMQKGK